MPSFLDFNELSRTTKIMIVSFTIFVMTLAVGILAFGHNETLQSGLNTDSLRQGGELLHFSP